MSAADQDPAHLQNLLDALSPRYEPLDVSMLDGYLCGILLQPKPVAEEKWLPTTLDLQGRPLAAEARSAQLIEAIRSRHRTLEQAISRRDWFDPWIYELEDAASPSESVLPWVGGFGLAMDRFPALMRLESPDLLEPLALLYRHFDIEDLEDADELLAQIAEIEPAEDLAEAVEDVVRSVMLIADVSRPVAPGRSRR